MSQWLVSTVPGWLILLGLTVVIAGGAVLIQTIVRRRYPALMGDEHNDVVKFTYGFIGFVYAFFIGFVVSSMWGQISTADGNARDEGAAAVQLARNLHLFNPADSDRIRQSLLTYEQAAVVEWTRAGESRSVEADTALTGLYAAYREVTTTTDVQATVLASSLSNVDKISQARTVRLFTARDDVGPPWPLWVVIFVNSAMVVGTVILYGVAKPILNYPMVVVVSVIVAMNLFLVLELSHPYLGEVGTTSDPLQEVVRVLSQHPG